MSIHVDAERVCRLLNVGRWVLIGGAVWVGLDTLAFLPELPRPALAENSNADSTSVPAASQTRLESLSSLWERNIRQTLIEPPPPPPEPRAAPAPPPPPPKLPRLLATFEESNRAWALFVDEAGSEQLRAVGTLIDQFEVTSVSAGRARLRSGTSSFEVEVPREEQAARRSGRRG